MDLSTLIGMIASLITIIGVIVRFRNRIGDWLNGERELELFFKEVAEAVRNQDIRELKRLQSEIEKTKYDKYRFKVAFNVAIMMLSEVIASHEKAVRIIQDDNQVVHILRTQNSELFNFTREMIIYHGDQRSRLERMEEINRRYETILEHLGISIPQIIARQSRWLMNYERLKRY